MNYSDKAFQKYFKTKNKGTFTQKGIWMIKLHLSDENGWEWNEKDFETLCQDIDLTKWYQLKDLTDTQVMKFRRENKDKTIIKVMKSSLVINN